MAQFNAKSFNPQAFGKYVETVPNLKRNALIQSGALVGNAAIAEAFSNQTGTAYAILPMYGSLSGAPQNYDGMTDITASTTGTFERGVVVVGRAKAWVEDDFSIDITGGTDFMDHVGSQIASFWDGVDQDTLLSILKGIFSMTGEANLAFVNNHTTDISAENGADALVGPTTLNDAIFKACGDNKNQFSVVICHSKIATNLENLNLLGYAKYTDENGIAKDLSLATWNGRTVLIDDSMPVTQVEEGYTCYTTYVLGEGAFDYADIGAKVPYEMSRDPKTNGGRDTLYSRQRKVFAPKGISYTKSSQESLSPTQEELELATNWTLASDGAASPTYFDHKAIPIARIISRG